MGELVKLHSVFLRKECQMPAHLDLAQQPCADNWMLVEEIGAPVLDTMIRHAGWHFMHLQGSVRVRGSGSHATTRPIVRWVVRSKGSRSGSTLPNSNRLKCPPILSFRLQKSPCNRAISRNIPRSK